MIAARIVLRHKNNGIFRLAFPESSINMIEYELSISSATAVRGRFAGVTAIHPGCRHRGRIKQESIALIMCKTTIICKAFALASLIITLWQGLCLLSRFEIPRNPVHLEA